MSTPVVLWESTAPDSTVPVGPSGLAAWEAEDQHVLPPGTPSREQQLGADRAADLRGRERDAIDALLAATAPASERTVVLAHRHSWLADRLGAVLTAAGCAVVVTSDDAARTLAAAVVLQPDLLFISELLPGGLGTELIERVRRLSPGTRVAVQVESRAALDRMRDLGASAVYDSQAGPSSLSEALLRLIPPRDGSVAA